ncbi:class I SAM-dependent methyltransferase [Streptomyces albofaciens JCM 4342]|uniref:class I SAM-dependent methyltransferase n=1 Tax=Streptomyces albofaciens TaxID=66866 RepID=UPI0012399F85|nr:class I SAM-dependent methyltransferase [Streptomyces albofaciens]KAA6224417.1 class I SAM-dependent methyltransferase [Streptomyces albofaciens JCM 4342]
MTQQFRPATGPVGIQESAESWDAMYRSREQVFSGAPNPVLVGEVTGLPPGQALDVGCGEGADALWLARRGWQVTAVDVSQVALRRAAATAADLATDFADRVAWARADLTATPPPAEAFDLVSVQYFPLRREPDHTALRGLLRAVAPGGTLLFVSHDLSGLAPRPEDGFDPADYYEPDGIARLLDPADWSVESNETRPRTTPPPAGTHHTHDTVLRARRVR